jgi:cardiolipin synthase
VADGRSSGAARTAAAPAAVGVPAGAVPEPVAAVPVAPAERLPTPGLSAVPARQDRLWTLPNLLSVLRLAGVPLFCYLLLGPHQDLWALFVLAVGGITDWLDGKVARLLGQYSRFGARLDAGTDRLYVLAALLAFGAREIVPWWLVAVLVGRDLVLTLCLPVLRSRGYGPFVVAYLGKAATFLLFWAFPVLLAGRFDNPFGLLCATVAPALLGWGTALYIYGGVLYLLQVAVAVRHPATAPRGRAP